MINERKFVMFNVYNLIKNEYFPAELPPCFNTNDLADFTVNGINLDNTRKIKFSIPLKFNGYKKENSRRIFSVPNPYHYCKTVNLIVENESELLKIFKKSKYSLTSPLNEEPDKDQSYSKRTKSVFDTKCQIEKLYENNKYEIHLDISGFFDNIYTHSIPWAMYGINIAKNKMYEKTLLGNKLDESVRFLNYNQTKGILVGNAVSRIISEIILCTIDEKINKKFNQINCCRFVDDYYIYTNDSTKIQEIISFVRICLAQYELSLNENKIKINESPFIYGKPWVEEIKQFIYLKPDVFLTKLIIEYNNYKDIAILKYGLKILSNYSFSKTDWQTMQSRLINLFVRFPSLADRILPILLMNKSNINKNLLKKAIYTNIDESVLLNHDQELIWSVWYIKVFNIGISNKYISKIFNSKNDIAIIILFDIVYKLDKQNSAGFQKETNKLLEEFKVYDKNDKNEENNLLWSKHWLLAYEIGRNKWINNFEYVEKNEFFNVLLNNEVGFYDSNYEYPNIIKNNMKYEYATRSELYANINKLRKLISNRNMQGIKNNDSLSNDESQIITNIFDSLLKEESEYI